jgi:hypothetical protein
MQQSRKKRPRAAHSAVLWEVTPCGHSTTAGVALMLPRLRHNTEALGTATAVARGRPPAVKAQPRDREGGGERERRRRGQPPRRPTAAAAQSTAAVVVAQPAARTREGAKPEIREGEEERCPHGGWGRGGGGGGSPPRRDTASAGAARAIAMFASERSDLWRGREEETGGGAFFV